MPRYLISSPVRHGGRRYLPGEVAELDGVEPALLARGVVQPLPAAADAAGDPVRLGAVATDGSIPPRRATAAKPPAGDSAGRGKARPARKTRTSETKT
jgi:hypothetical protein